MIGSAVMGSDNEATISKFMPERLRRYALGGYKWGKTDLTFRFLSYTSDMTDSEQRDAIYRSFKHWSDVTPLTFTEVSNGEADILIEFATGVHSDGPGAAFDGPGGTLAHAYFPEDGDMHFDDDEYFTVNSDHGINLDFTATHELGHSLGLSHSGDQNAIMYPFYLGYVPDLQLKQDDIIGIQTLYGSNEADVITDGTPVDPGAPDVCTSDFDAVLTDYDKNTLVIKGLYLWKLHGNDGVVSGYPRRLKEEFPGLPGNINTGFTSFWSGRTFFFKGDRFWRFYGSELEAGYPKNIQGTGLPRNPDAAFVWSGDGKIYIFKRSKYYIWNENDEKVIPGGVRSIRKHWAGIPSKIDAAFSWVDGNTYFFKGNSYWLFNDMEMRVEYGYPKDKSEDWLNCN
ncbi:matrix metalloproteinase-19-like [Saccoglossus kowalevskii]|uniref:Matrix metalloproteinase-19-like n=1 Tax=Saccoglossus kowalevskii TaxID=10224 RepID=A0ABM0GIS0_SACKO|nr:PREDICTED: matrix metalloproteinase-19-like [Saccoglossus kowalevskii]